MLSTPRRQAQTGRGLYGLADSCGPITYVSSATYRVVLGHLYIEFRSLVDAGWSVVTGCYRSTAADASLLGYDWDGKRARLSFRVRWGRSGTRCRRPRAPAARQARRGVPARGC